MGFVESVTDLFSGANAHTAKMIRFMREKKDKI